MVFQWFVPLFYAHHGLEAINRFLACLLAIHLVASMFDWLAARRRAMCLLSSGFVSGLSTLVYT